MLANRWSAHTPWWQTLLTIVAGVFVWLATLRSQRHPLLAELKRIARRVVGTSGGGKS
jgi:hypothetical protein